MHKEGCYAVGLPGRVRVDGWGESCQAGQNGGTRWDSVGYPDCLNYEDWGQRTKGWAGEGCRERRVIRKVVEWEEDEGLPHRGNVAK